MTGLMALLASPAPSQVSPPQDASAGYVALLIVVLLGIATALLIRNMSTRLKRLPKEFGPPHDQSAPEQGRPEQGR